MAKRPTAGGGDTGGDTGRGPSTMRMSTATSNKYWGLADSAAVHINGTELGSQDWRDALFLWYGLEPPDLPTHCDGCNAKFKISHALDCNRGGLFTERNNELCDGVADLAGKSFTPSNVCNKPLIYSGCVVKKTKATPDRDIGTTDQAGAPPPEVMEQKGDLLISFL